MIEGIIQKVLSKHYKYLEYPTLLEKELIAEIKNNFPITKPFLHIKNHEQIQHKLIGDTE